MGKTQVAATSLVMALPAGLLAYLTIMAGLQHTESMPTMMMAVVWGTAVISVIMALFPVGTLVLMKSVPAADKGSVAKTAAIPSGDADVSGAEVEAAEDGSGLSNVSGELDDDSVASGVSEPMDNMEPIDDDLALSQDELALSDDELPMDDFEEEEAPKKKKKK